MVLAFLAIAKCAAVDHPNIESLVPKNPAPIHETTESQAEISKMPKPFNEKYAQLTSNGAYLTDSYPVYSTPIHTPLYPAQYSISPVVTNQYAGPNYHHGIPVVTKTYSTPVQTTLAYSPHLNDHSLKTLTYSEAPLVSHMTFTGLGTNYAW